MFSLNAFHLPRPFNFIVAFVFPGGLAVYAHGPPAEVARCQPLFTPGCVCVHVCVCKMSVLTHFTKVTHNFIFYILYVCMYINNHLVFITTLQGRYLHFKGEKTEDQKC